MLAKYVTKGRHQMSKQTKIDFVFVLSYCINLILFFLCIVYVR